jgi:hypothetical protein
MEMKELLCADHLPTFHPRETSQQHLWREYRLVIWIDAKSDGVVPWADVFRSRNAERGTDAI